MNASDIDLNNNEAYRRVVVNTLAEIRDLLALNNQLLLEVTGIGGPTKVPCPKCKNEVLANGLGYCPKCNYDLAGAGLAEAPKPKGDSDVN